MKITCRPLSGWPGELRTPSMRVSSPFRSGWENTTRLLIHEADMLGANEIIIRLALAEAEIRQDGWPYARSQPRHPGVVVVLPRSDQGRVSFQTDRYLHWQDNARAIGLAIEALRKADRYGVTQGRQYAGFRELPAGEQTQTSSTGVEQADVLVAATLIVNACKSAGRRLTEVDQRDLITLDPQRLLDDRAALYRWYRAASRATHPDVGGDAEAFRLVQQAYQVLRNHHDELDLVVPA